METEADFIFLGSKITTDSVCSHEMKRCLLLGRKAMTKLDSLFKSRDTTLPTEVRVQTHGPRAVWYHALGHTAVAPFPQSLDELLPIWK